MTVAYIGTPHTGFEINIFLTFQIILVTAFGFNEDFVGWGREDSEFVARLYNSGVKRRNLRFGGLGCHIHHPPRSRDSLEQNDRLLAEAIDAKRVRCERGLNLHAPTA